MKSRIDSKSSLVEFLTEFASYLVAAGVSVSQFQGAAQIAFLRAAALHARFSNSKVNQSAVAAMTGLTRSQVRLMLRTPAKAASHRESRVEQVVKGWLTDPGFTTAAGNARVLKRSGRGQTFAALARKYGGDVPARALQVELSRQGFIKLSGDRVALSSIARRIREPVELNHLSAALAKLISRTEVGVGNGHLRLLSAQANYETPAAAGRVLLQRRINQGLKALVTDVEAAGSSIAKTSRRKGSPVRRMSRTSVLLVSQD
jgi:hypothetical protein